MTGTDLLSAEGLSFAYRGERLVLDGVEFALGAGQRMGVVGGNGAGKTTLVKLVLGLMRPTSGAIRVFGVDPRSGPPLADLGYIGNPSRNDGESGLPGDVRVGRLLVAYRRLFEATGRSLPYEGELRRSLGLDDANVADRFVRELSDGWRQRVIAYLALAKAPRLLVGDEPTTGLDPDTRAELLATVRRFADLAGVAILWSSHHFDEFLALGAEVHRLREGKLAREQAGAFRVSVRVNGEPTARPANLPDPGRTAVVGDLLARLNAPGTRSIEFVAEREGAE